MPEARMDRILSVLEPAAVLTSGSMGARAREACGDCPVLLVEDLAARPADEALLASLRARIKSSDPLYILFTSGSTGMPKGVVGTHQTVLNNLEWLASRFDLGPDDVLGNQAPLHFVVADDGAGMEEEALARLREVLDCGNNAHPDHSYGISSVAQRLYLVFNNH